MKNYFVLIVLLFLCASFAPSSNEEKSMETLIGFYAAMSDYNYTLMDDYCTTDFSLIDNGKYLKDIGEFADLVRTFEGAEVDIKMELLHSKFSGKTGLLIIVFDVDITMGDDKMHIKAMESYSMRKERGKWLIDFIHSTPIEE